jgi:hypothetical protein
MPNRIAARSAKAVLRMPPGDYSSAPVLDSTLASIAVAFSPWGMW